MRGNDDYPRRYDRPRSIPPSGEGTTAGFSGRGMSEEFDLFTLTPEMRRAYDRVKTAAIRGAAAGVLIKGGLHTLTFVMYLLSRVRGKGRQRVTTLSDALHDTVLYTCFLAAIGSSYTAMDEGIALIFGKARTQRWRALVAGLVAGQSLRITGPNRRHYSLATYILLRGLTLLVRTGNKPSAPPALRAMLRVTRIENGDTLLMCVAASQILYSFIMAPSTLPPAYVRFITRMGGKDPAVWAAIREHAVRNAAGLSPGPLQSLVQTPLAFLNARPGRLRRTPCEFFHPGQSCMGHAVSVVPPAYGTSLALYVPFYLVSSVLVHRTALLVRPKELLPKMALAVLRSSAFLSVYIAAAFAGACTGFGVTGVNSGTVIAASVWAGGLATLLEKKSRRMELAMYCAARALEAFIRCCWLWRRKTGPETGSLRRGTAIGGGRPAVPVPRALLAMPRGMGRGPVGAASLPDRGGARTGPGLHPFRLDVLLFSLGCGAIMHCYSDACGQHRDVFRSKYLNVLDFVFGNEGLQSGSICHVPTNGQLFSSVRRRLRSMSRGMISATTSGECSPLPRSQSSNAGVPSTGDAFGGMLLHGSDRTTAYGDRLGDGGLSPESSYTAPGHGHHGSHGYYRYLRLQQQQQQQHTSKDSMTPLSGGNLAPISPPLTSQQQQAAAATVGSVAVAATAAAAVITAPCSPAGSRAELPVPPVQGPRDGLQEGRRGRREDGPGQVRSGGRGGGSDSGSDWEDVWAATTGAGSNGDAAAAPAAASTTITVDATVSGGVPDVPLFPSGSSDPAFRGGSAAAAPSAPTGGFSGSALGWAARLVAGAFGAAGGRGTDAAAAAMADPSASTSSGPPASVRAPGRAGPSISMRRTMTAPPGVAASAQALKLLTDPASELRGHGRSSYKQLQHLNAGGDAAAAATASPVEGPSVSSPMPSSSAPSPHLGAPSKARSVPVPNAASRTPAFQPSPYTTLASAPASSWSLAAAEPPAASAAAPWPRSVLGRAFRRGASNLGKNLGGSLQSHLDSLVQGPTGGNGGASASAGGSGAVARDIEVSRSMDAFDLPSAVTFTLRGAVNHPSPVPGAAAWPRVSLELPGGAAVGLSCSAPEARAVMTLAAIAAEDSMEEDVVKQEEEDEEEEVEMEEGQAGAEERGALAGC